MLKPQQTQRIYAMAARLGVLESGNKNDMLHTIVYRLTQKESIRSLDENEYKTVVSELAERLKLQNLTEPPKPYKKKKYEDLHKDDVYEEGKKGIQIYVNNQKSNAGAVQSQILDNRDEVYFTEYAYYYSMKAEGVLGDITDAVTADLKSFGDKDGSTIESKLTAEQKAYFGVSESDGKTHYYAIPHYSAYTGICLLYTSPSPRDA